MVAFAFFLAYGVADAVLPQVTEQASRETGGTSDDDEIGIDDINELRRDLLDYRANHLERWLIAVAVFITFLAFLSTALGLIGYFKFKKYEAEAEEATERIKKRAEEAEETTERTKKRAEEAEEKTIAVLDKVLEGAREVEARIKKRATAVEAYMKSRMREGLREKINSETKTDD